MKRSPNLSITIVAFTTYFSTPSHTQYRSRIALGLRGMRVAETDDDVTMEIELPFWIDAADVRVHISDTQLQVDVRNTLSLQRVYWRNRY